MALIITSEIETEQGPTVQFICPHCGRKSIATTYAHYTSYSLFYFIPLFSSTSNHMSCTSCKRQFDLKLDIDEASDLDPNELEDYIMPAGSKSSTFMAVIALPPSWVPLFGFIVNLIALIVNLHLPGWRRKVTIIGFCVSLLITGFCLYAMYKTGAFQRV